MLLRITHLSSQKCTFKNNMKREMHFHIFFVFLDGTLTHWRANFKSKMQLYSPERIFLFFSNFGKV